jgi:hypothetical protein
MKIIGIEEWRKQCKVGGESNVRKEQNGRESLRRIKPIGGCNAGERRRRRYLGKDFRYIDAKIHIKYTYT